MYVYRIMTKKEFERWNNNDITMGACYTKCSENSHNYFPKTKYLHFFKNLDDCLTVLGVLGIDANYLCKFNIDEEILKVFEGKGRYFQNGQSQNGTVEIKEFAIPTKLLKRQNFDEYITFNDENEIKFLDGNKHWTQLEKENIDTCQMI